MGPRGASGSWLRACFPVRPSSLPARRLAGTPVAGESLVPLLVKVSAMLVAGCVGQLLAVGLSLPSTCLLLSVTPHGLGISGEKGSAPPNYQEQP